MFYLLGKPSIGDQCLTKGVSKISAHSLLLLYISEVGSGDRGKVEG